MAQQSPALTAQTGTLASGVVTVSGALPGYRSFAAALADGDTVDVVLRDAQGDQASYPASAWDETAGTLTLGTVGVSAGTITDGAVTIWAAGIGAALQDVSDDATPTLGGDLDVDGYALDDYAETAYTIPTTTGTYTLNLSNGMVQSVTLTGALTLTMPAAPATGVTRSFVLEVDCDGSVLSWAASPAIQWAGGAAPTLETGAGAFNEMTFRYSHLASAWVGRLTASEAA